MAKRDDIITTDPAEIERLIERLKQGELEQHETQLLERLLRLLLSLIGLLQQKNASIKRLKRMLFGPRSDQRTATGTNSKDETEDRRKEEQADAASNSSSATAISEPPSGKPKRAGHGRRAASAYTGAKVVICKEAQFQPGDRCPDAACRGQLYDTQAPAILIRLTGQPMVGATRYEQEVLRCSACQQRFTAPLPEGVKPEKYDATADVAVAMAKYAAGVPFYRLARLQAMCGVPLSESVQFERCEAVADAVLPVFLHLRGLAADGEVFYADDTRVKILACRKEDQAIEADEQRATQTSGMVVEVRGRWIVLYASGRRHAGENLDELLKKRSGELAVPIQMGDALSANWSGEAETMECKCWSHARRKFIEIQESFPEACSRVLDAIAEVYRVEAETDGMSAEQRVQHHQEQSGPGLEKLREWIEEQFVEREVEPNSVLGQALRYLIKHWEGLTRFLTVAGVPLDNNLAERALKRAVLLRKNALFYKNEHGAAIGDILMSVIETCRLNGVSAWAYLVALLRHAKEARRNPDQYLPWNYPRGEPAEEALEGRAA